MSHSQQDTALCPIHQVEPPAHPSWKTLTPVVALFAAGLRPLHFAIGQGALVLAPLVALLGLDNAAEQMLCLHAHDPSHFVETHGKSLDDESLPTLHPLNLDGDYATETRSARVQTGGN